MKIEIFRSKKGNKQHYFRVRATNGRILCVSEGYTRKASCMKSAESLRRTINPKTPIVEV